MSKSMIKTKQTTNRNNVTTTAIKAGGGTTRGHGKRGARHDKNGGMGLKRHLVDSSKL